MLTSNCCEHHTHASTWQHRKMPGTNVLEPSFVYSGIFNGILTSALMLESSEKILTEKFTQIHS